MEPLASPQNAEQLHECQHPPRQRCGDGPWTLEDLGLAWTHIDYVKHLDMCIISSTAATGVLDVANSRGSQCETLQSFHDAFYARTTCDVATICVDQNHVYMCLSRGKLDESHELHADALLLVQCSVYRRTCPPSNSHWPELCAYMSGDLCTARVIYVIACVNSLHDWFTPLAEMAAFPDAAVDVPQQTWLETK